MKFMFLCFIIAVVQGNNEDLELIDSIKQEKACSNAGGICTVKDDCPVGYEADDGLCPDQRMNGIECCYAVSTKETRCNKNGGECMAANSCPETLLIDKETDCASGTECCTLVR